MNETRTQQACRLFNSPFVPDHINGANRAKWLRMVDYLGPRWKLAHVAPIPEAAQPTLGQLRERLKEARANAWGLMPYSETESVADHMELRLREREIAAGLREDATGPAVTGAV